MQMFKRFFSNLFIIALVTVVLATVMYFLFGGIKPGEGWRAIPAAVFVSLFIWLPWMFANAEGAADEVKRDRDRAWEQCQKSQDEGKKKDTLISLFLRQKDIDAGLTWLAQQYAQAHADAAGMTAGANAVRERSQDKLREFSAEYGKRLNKAYAALSGFSNAAESAKDAGFTVYEVEHYLKEPEVAPV